MTQDMPGLEMPIVRDATSLRAQIRDWRAQGLSVALVPTMGALHEGHLSLVDLAGAQADRVVVSIFVNPTQFAPGEDYDAYPRKETEDMAKLTGRHAHLVYMPDTQAVYAPGFATSVTVGGVGVGLETDFRPHFFTGVATVVTKLLMQCMPDMAVFGEKDYQQLLVIRRLVADLDLPVRIVAGPTVREADGLALSSRNVYLDAGLRARAPILYKVLRALAGQLEKGDPVHRTIAAGWEMLVEAGFDPIEYLEVRDAETLEPLDELDRPGRLLAAVRMGDTRLIDNVPVNPRIAAPEQTAGF